MYDSSPCAFILNIRNAQSGVISPTHIWATARHKEGTARGLISPPTALAVAIGPSSGANARVGGATQDFFGLIGGHVGQGIPQYPLRFPPTFLSLPQTLLSPCLSTIPPLLTLPQPHKGTHQSAYNGGSSAQHGRERISIHILA